MTNDEIVKRFTYHAPTPVRTELHGKIRDGCTRLAVSINMTVPEGREKSLAFTKLEEVMFWANAGIARVETYYGE